MARQRATKKLRENTLPHIDYQPGNYFPFIDTQTAIIQPHKKGCKYIDNMMNPKTLNPNESSRMDKPRTFFPNIPLIPMEPHIKSLNKTSPLPWSTDLQL